MCCITENMPIFASDSNVQWTAYDSCYFFNDGSDNYCLSDLILIYYEK